MTDTAVAISLAPLRLPRPSGDIPTAVKEPHSANNHIGSLLPVPLEGRIDKSTETGESSKEGNDIGPSLC
jgi:hypothetical protein